MKSMLASILILCRWIFWGSAAAVLTNALLSHSKFYLWDPNSYKNRGQEALGQTLFNLCICLSIGSLPLPFAHWLFSCWSVLCWTSFLIFRRTAVKLLRSIVSFWPTSTSCHPSSTSPLFLFLWTSTLPITEQNPWGMDCFPMNSWLSSFCLWQHTGYLGASYTTYCCWDW